MVDYLGLADELKQALATYTDSGGTGKTAIDQAEAVAIMLEKFEICQGLFGSYTTPAGMVRGFDWSRWISGKSVSQCCQPRWSTFWPSQTAKPRLLRAVTDLSQAFALAVPHEETFLIRDDVGFFQAVRSVLAKKEPAERAEN